MGRFIECERCGKEKHDDHFEYPDICTECIGSCRFNCRSQKEAFVAGCRAIWDPESVEQLEYEQMMFKKWLKDRA